MGRRAGYAPSAIIVIGGTTLLTLAPLVPAAGGETAGALTITVVLLAALAYLLHRADAGVAAPSALADFLLTLGGTVYVGLLFGYLVALRMLPDGRGYLALLLLAIFAADTGAFVVGRRWGRRRLSPAISPNKTFEGALGGLAAGVLSALALVWLLGLPFAWWQSLLIGALVTLAGMLGDLAESALKRGLGAKDAGGLIPGHGGMLDRADSLLVAGVVLYFAVRTLGPVS
jgi:phosphatidate cytidylyltransferase